MSISEAPRKDGSLKHFFQIFKIFKKKINVTILVYIGLLNWGKIFVLLKKVSLTPKSHPKGQKCKNANLEP